MTLDQFIRNLTASGLLTAEELKAFRRGLPADQQPKDVPGLAKALVQAGKLTKYQAGAIYQGKTKGLVLGEYVILDRIGAGGMGEVLKARHRRMKREVALNSPDAVPAELKATQLPGPVNQVPGNLAQILATGAFLC
jgi:hypothetical protein